MSLEQRGSKPGHLRFDLGARHMQGSAADGLRAAAEGADALLRDGGVAMQDRHMLDGHAELIGQHLSKRRFVALPLR